MSKIAKIRAFEEDPCSIRNLMANVYNAVRDKSPCLRNESFAKNIGASTFIDAKISSKLSYNGFSDNPLDNEIGQESLRCRTIRDVYMPEIKENVPSYARTSEGKTFILSSKRFLQDRIIGIVCASTLMMTRFIN